MKNIFFFLALFLNQSYAQHKLEYSIGGGISLWGQGDGKTFDFENEIAYNIHPNIQSSFSFLYGTVRSEGNYRSSLLQGNLNGFILPFGNRHRYILKLGGGISFMDYKAVSFKSGYRDPTTGKLIAEEYYYDNYSTIGNNLIIENDFKLNNKFILGLKMFAQFFNAEISGDTNVGGILKLGYIIK